MSTYQWPYKNEIGQEEEVSCDVLVLGGGLAGCYAAIAAARKGKKVIVVEKGATERSGAAGSGFDHWESACTNPCSRVTPKEIAEAYIEEQDYYSNGIATISNAGRATIVCWIWKASAERCGTRRMSSRAQSSG